MKTAISIPDDLFEKAEKTAKELGLPRSRLFALAIEEFIDHHSKETITEKLNLVYGKQNQSSPEESNSSRLSTAILRETLADDTW